MKSVVIIVIVALVVSGFFYFQLTGKVTGGPNGPSAAGMECMIECTTINCDVEDMGCRTAASTDCGVKCGVETEAPKPADEGEACMQKCIVVGCEKFDVACENKNMGSCEDECDMKGDAPDESEMDAEQLCISNCVAEEDPTMICGNSKEGETGGALCQKCAKSCESLYSGPCLNDEQVTEKENECISKCEHCYGGPIEGPSGQGWDCIVDIKCGDASDEFGDDAGTGPGIGQEGYVAPNAVAGAVDGVIRFFKGLFGGE